MLLAGLLSTALARITVDTITCGASYRFRILEEALLGVWKPGEHVAEGTAHTGNEIATESKSKVLSNISRI